jgi:hypothetical protein
MLMPNPPYVPLVGPGAYQLTPPAFGTPINSGAASWRPFVLTDAAQFRPNGPLPLTHPRYADDLAEVRAIGKIDGPRTTEQTISALWHVELAPPGMNRIARTEALARDLELIDTARLFALLNVAMADASTSVFEAKYFFNYWRPITAIREAASDGNPSTWPDPTWTPLLGTPAHPEYPSGHSVIQWAGTEVLEAVFGQNYTFSTTSAAVPGVVRTFGSFKDYSADASLSRVYGGIHFRTAIEEGARQGRKVGNWVLEHALVPVR